ncbi:SpaH/EbpB family LPXTG-anchored major pilin [Trueperella abortisuis]|uniref:SpaH/EbpB family LPXTG-anchored major pilin n=1 Tax=Trueperella abortisuis TaxID=445930 RepID=UPI002892D42E|nr:SpaH/EbpB family LPXTG-anchored major pilin [Trueperella abortisuis]
MHFLKKMKQRAAAAMVVAVASVLTLGVGVANAAPAPGDMPTGQGSITIHKHKEVGNTNQLKPDGTSQAPSDPLKGVEFTVTKIDGLNLTNNADWAKVKDLTVDKLGQGGITKGTSQKVTTTDDGSVVVSNLDMGVYLVEETGIGDNAITKKAAPFFVTIPLPFDGKWITNVHVYPKNVIQPPGKKEVTNDTQTHKVGDVLEWTIEMTATTDSPKAFGVVDELKDYLSYVDQSAKVYLKDSVDPLTDVTVEPLTGGKNGVKITLGDTARAQIKKGDTVKFVLKTTVTKMPDSGIVENSAWPIDNDYNPFDDPNVTTPPIVPTKDPYFGDYKFKKVDADTPGKVLSGAEFGLYQCNGDQTTGDAIATVASGEDGVVAFNGIYLGKFDKGTAADQATKEFCLKETKAPAGYVLSEKVTKVTIKAGKVTTPTEQLTTVTNTQQPGPDLPLTGAAGTLLLTVVGIGLVGAGVALYAVNSRSRKQR